VAELLVNVGVNQQVEPVEPDLVTGSKAPADDVHLLLVGNVVDLFPGEHPRPQWLGHDPESDAPLPAGRGDLGDVLDEGVGLACGVPPHLFQRLSENQGVLTFRRSA